MGPHSLPSVRTTPDEIGDAGAFGLGSVHRGEAGVELPVHRIGGEQVVAIESNAHVIESEPTWAYLCPEGENYRPPPIGSNTMPAPHRSFRSMPSNPLKLWRTLLARVPSIQDERDAWRIPSPRARDPGLVVWRGSEQDN
jgi:hypothetical protein